MTVAVVAVAIALGCESFHTLSRNKKVSQGAPYEVLVVCNAPEWEGELGKELRALLEAPVPMLNQTVSNCRNLRCSTSCHTLPFYDYCFSPKNTEQTTALGKPSSAIFQRKNSLNLCF